MEPHWNESRIKQVIGRAIRYKSHSELEEKDRHVQIYRWSSTFPDTIANKSADEYLIELSKNKDEIFHTFDEIIQNASIEARKNKSQKGGATLQMWERYKENRENYLRLKMK